MRSVTASRLRRAVVLFLHCVSERVFERVFETADGILNLAFGLIGLSFGLQLCITYRFADGLFD